MNIRVALRLLVLGLVFVGPASVQWGNAQNQAPGRQQNQATPTGSPQELFKRLSLSVFVVETLDEKGSVAAIGSGVVLAPGHVVTNKHVIEGGVAWRIRRGRVTWPATLSQLDPDHDLCQLKAEGLKAPSVPVRASTTLAVGERVYAIGAPEGLELTLSEGLISGLREFEHVRLIQTSAAISPGSSGGGLFDAQGRLVGVTTFFLKEGQNLNFALPGEWVQALATHEVSAGERNQNESPTLQASQWFLLGSQAAEARDYEQAVRAYREAVRLKPDLVRAWYNLGDAYADLIQLNRAVRAYQEAIRLKPDYSDAWCSLGFAYDNLGQYNRAVRAYQEAIRLKPDYYAWYSLGIAYEHFGQYDQAVRAYQEAIRLKPDDSDAWYNLGDAYAQQGNRSKVMQVYQELKTLDPKTADEFFQAFLLP